MGEIGAVRRLGSTGVSVLCTSSTSFHPFGYQRLRFGCRGMMIGKGDFGARTQPS